MRRNNGKRPLQFDSQPGEFDNFSMITKKAPKTQADLLEKLLTEPCAKLWQKRRHLLSTEDLSLEEISYILALAKYFKGNRSHHQAPLAILNHSTIANLFYENSTRTRSSFELAARKLGVTVLNLDLKASSVAKGETLKDTALNLWAMGVNAVVMRHSQSGAPMQLAQECGRQINVINAGDGAHAHPSQGLLDLFTILENLDLLPSFNTQGKLEQLLEENSLKGIKVAIIGDILHSRVARSNLWLLNKLGATVAMAGPPALLPSSFKNLAQVSHRLHQVLKDADYIICLRLQLERQEQGLIAGIDDYTKNFRIDHNRLCLANPQVKILHPGPINRGIEITNQLADDPERSLILQQVENGILCRMAIIAGLLGGETI